MESLAAFSCGRASDRNDLLDNTYRYFRISIRNFLVCCQISSRKRYAQELHICVKSFVYRSRPRVGIRKVLPRCEKRVHPMSMDVDNISLEIVTHRIFEIWTTLSFFGMVEPFNSNNHATVRCLP